MNCGSSGLSPIAIDFQHGGTLYPAEASFKYNTSEYDYLTCKFDISTANEIQRQLNGPLSNEQRAVVRIEDIPIRSMYFKPEFVRVGRSNVQDGKEWPGYLELHDLHEALQSGTVDYAPRVTTLKKTYREIFQSRASKNLVPEMDFRVDDNPKITRSDNDMPVAGGADWLDYPFDIDLGWSLNLDQISPLKAIEKANRIFGVSTHIDSDGTLIIGEYSGTNTYTASDTGSGSDFHISSAGITRPSKTLKRVNIEGPKVHPGLEGYLGIEEAIEEVGEWLNHWDEDNDVGFRIQAVVENTEADDGKVVNVNAHNTNVFELRNLAVRQFRAVQSRVKAGSVTIDTQTSNRSHPLQIGDGLVIAEPKGCGLMQRSAYPGGEYYVTGVTHTYNSSWKMQSEVLQVPTDPDNLEVRVRYIDVSSGQKYTHEDIYGVPLSEDSPDTDINEPEFTP